ncbi:UPF0149 family protein [Thiotrichales bacterium 19X7-9]|nr:UPF0149 family protein [Thiotrichales bacterium 19X7-9]TNF65394.1 MAG: YecA family protein [Gammaproteobacteria bacterium]UTW41815.1 UPF0149 family protein [bacterium SCSIO 12844]
MSNEEEKMPEFDEVAKALKHLKAMTEVAESHGLLCALFSGGADVRISAWVDSMLTTFVEEGDIMAENALVVLAGVFEATKNQYQSGFYDLELLLPDDSTSFHQRIDALAMWCQGFLSGLGLMGFAFEASHSQEIKEAITDLSKMSALQYDEEEEGDEESEKAYNELVEYAKVAALLLHAELSALNQAKAKPLHSARDLTDD